MGENGGATLLLVLYAFSALYTMYNSVINSTVYMVCTSYDFLFCLEVDFLGTEKFYCKFSAVNFHTAASSRLALQVSTPLISGTRLLLVLVGLMPLARNRSLFVLLSLFPFFFVRGHFPFLTLFPAMRDNSECSSAVWLPRHSVFAMQTKLLPYRTGNMNTLKRSHAPSLR